MAVSAEWIQKVMGSPDSVTAKLVSMRRTPGDGQLETGVWYSNFTRVKSEAESRGIPFFAMWTNGDVCGFCRRFTANVLSDAFQEYMRKSGGLWWLGGSMDDSDEDKRGGVGFMWCVAPDRHVRYYPFVAVSAVRDGRRVERFGSGHDYDRKLDAPHGAVLAAARLREFVDDTPVQTKPAEAKTPPDRAVAHVREAARGPLLHIRFNREWDAAHIARFQHALNENGGHCVCQEKSPDTVCMCRSFLEQDKPGPCRCGAFEKFTV